MDNLESDSLDSEPTCRICYSRDTDGIEGKLVCPCECRGTIRFVHSNCIEQWAKIASNNSYDSLDTLKWELCHSIFKKRRQLESLKNIIKNLAKNFKDHLTSHFESLIIMAYMGFLAYRGVSDARIRYVPYKKKFGKTFATIWVVLYTTAMYVQIGCLLKREMKKLIKFFYIFKDSLFAYKYCDK